MKSAIRWIPAGVALALCAHAGALEGERRPMSQLIVEPSRTPSGFLYAPPFAPDTALLLGGGWSYRIAAEAGGYASSPSRGAATVRDGRDWSGGLFVNRFELALQNAADARYLDFSAAGVARDDASYALRLGREGLFRAGVFYRELPTILSSDARTIFRGAGGADLALPAGLVPGGNSPAQLAAALAGTNPFELGFSRRRAGLEFEADISERLRLHARYSQERKQGTRPIGGAASYPGVTTVELPEPIDYRTHDVQAGARWAGEKLQANAAYSGSFFRNAIGTLAWDYPLNVDPVNAAVLRRGRIDLYPDNDSHNLRLEAGAALPLRGRVTGSFSWTRMTQNDALVPPTLNSGTLGGAPPVDLANWNTTAALGEERAGARIDTRVARLSGSFSPVRDLTLQASARRHDEENRTRYRALNPLTGQQGYLGLDGGVNFIVPSLLRAQIASVPFAQRKDQLALEADWRFARRTSLIVSAERENVERDYRETARTHENRARAALNSSALSWAVVRVSYEEAKRSGDGYDHDPYRQFYAVALLETPATLAELRKFDLAGRRQRIANTRINLIVAPDMDLALSGRAATNDYDAQYGRLADWTRAWNIDWNWQPRPDATLYAHYGFARNRNRMASIADDPGSLGNPDPAAGGAVYPFANRWHETSDDRTQSFGAGFRYAFARASLESAFTATQSRYRTQYAFASPGALADPAAAGSAGDAMPDMLYREHSIETSLRIRLDRNTALRFFHRYERVRIEDWHYDALPLVFAGGAGVFLGAGGQSHSAHVLGFFVQYVPGKPD